MGWLPITCYPQVVTADGQLITANTEEHPDLLWGRGGGGNLALLFPRVSSTSTHDGDIGFALSSGAVQSSVTPF